jgi:hypothetical protein
LKVHQAHKVLLDLAVLWVNKVRKVLKAMTENKDQEANKDLAVFLVRLVLSEKQDHKVLKARRAMPEKKATKASQEKLDQPVLKVSKVIKETVEKRGTKVTKAIPERMVWTEEMDQKAKWVPLDLPENRVFKESAVLKEKEGFREFKESEDLKAFKDQRDRREFKVLQVRTVTVNK